jgi:HAD superfamily hydrolase (TIGR01484 family)
MHFQPHLVAFDLDGTLAESKQRVSLRMGEVFAKLSQKMPVAMLSGASFAQFETQFLPAIPNNAYFERIFLFPTNAASCYTYKDGSWTLLYDNRFNILERGRILQALKEAMVETGFDVPPATVWGERIEDRGAQITFSGLGQKAPPEEKIKWDPSKEKRKPLYDSLVRRIGADFAIGLNATTSIDITRKGITKAYGIKKLATLTGIPISEMLYVGDALGDGGNDSVVLSTGVHTKQVCGPEETLAVINSLLQ